jgi:hypothetical protein
MTDKRTNIIFERIRKSNKAIKERYFFDGNVFVFEKDSLPRDFNLDFVLKKVQDLVSRHLIFDLDAVYIGQFDFLDKHQYTATYRDGAIYVTNQQISEKDMIRDIVHEVSHMVEEQNEAELYGDRSLENEFLKKRRSLSSLLSSEGIRPPALLMGRPEFNPHLDQFFVKTVGYPLLITLINGIFNSPYAVTSLREYFARGFEEFLMGDRFYLKKISPVLYSKLEELIYPDEV